jgi:hypothetical protein
VILAYAVSVAAQPYQPYHQANARRQRLWWLGGISAALLMIVASVLALRDKPHQESRPASQTTASSMAAGAAGQAEAHPRSFATRWDDGSAERVSDVQNELEELEKTVERDWEDSFDRKP